MANFHSVLCMGLSRMIVPEDSPIRRTRPLPVTSSPNITTFHGRWGSRRERHVSTLPSPTSGKPLRLRVTESGLSEKGTRHASGGKRIRHTLTGQSSTTTATSPGGDFFSYDPYFSTGKYTVTVPSGRPYGNGLVMRMGWQFMILEDGEGTVLAAIKSRRTERPSAVVYSTKASFAGQTASGHRLTRQPLHRDRAGGGHERPGGISRKKKKRAVAVVEGNGAGVWMEDSEALYPWALISKSGRTMRDECAVHLASGGGPSSSSSAGGLFRSQASFRGRHCFDREVNTHTVVSRTAAAVSVAGDGGAGGSSTSLEEVEPVPCCVIVRDPTNLDVVDLTIAPGIDPLLMVCYLASHSKMDVEPLMSSGMQPGMGF